MMNKLVCLLVALVIFYTGSPPVLAQEGLLPQRDTAQAAQEEVGQAQTEPQEAQTPECLLLDTAALSPQKPESEQLGALVDELVDELTEEDMDTGEKVKACYDYLVDTVAYGSHMSRLSTPVGETTCRQIYANYGEVEGFGAVALTAKVGMCNAYAAAFILMTRSIGLEARLARGWTRSRGGGYTYHEWAEVLIDGRVYVFDPQLEQDLVQSGLAEYTVYAKTYQQLGARYKLKS